MSSLEQRLFDGTRAKEVLENEAFKGAFDAIENEVIEQWKNSPARDAEGRERIWTYLQLLKKVRMHLVSTMETGQLAELELKSRQSALDRAKTWIS